MDKSLNELELRHKRERMELEEQLRRDNTMVTMQANNLNNNYDEPYIIEIKFPNNLDYREKHRVNDVIDTTLLKLFKDLGYKAQWLEAKDSIEAKMESPMAALARERLAQEEARIELNKRVEEASNGRRHNQGCSLGGLFTGMGADVRGEECWCGFSNLGRKRKDGRP